MKRLLTLLFTAVIAFSLAMPAFAQDTGSQETTKTTEKKTKQAKTKKSKVVRKTKATVAPATEKAPSQ
jgi:hypothetical protein